ncbi:MAG TPA: TlpA disulfide reductase family protein [Chitinophagaceae bacterium]|nr:TlpA disulfide reductase family protein [Chitinophagaceae bacterium]
MQFVKSFMICAFLLFVTVIHGQGIGKVKITELEKTIRESKRPMIINFWATFCVPCVEEIPYFQSAVKAHARDSILLILVSLDLEDYYPAKIKNFATKKKILAPIVWLDEYNADYFCPKVDSSWSGAIPASLFINNKTGYRKFFEEQLSKEKLAKEITMLISKPG